MHSASFTAGCGRRRFGTYRAGGAPGVGEAAMVGAGGVAAPDLPAPVEPLRDDQADIYGDLQRHPRLRWPRLPAHTAPLGGIARPPTSAGDSVGLGCGGLGAWRLARSARSSPTIGA